MSRVTKPNKFVNTVSYDSSITNTSKMVLVRCETEDYHKARKLSHWLFVKYDMSYKTYRNKSRKRRDELRKEFVTDTGVKVKPPKKSKRRWWVGLIKDLL